MKQLMVLLEAPKETSYRTWGRTYPLGRSLYLSQQLFKLWGPFLHQCIYIGHRPAKDKQQAAALRAGQLEALWERSPMGGPAVVMREKAGSIKELLRGPQGRPSIMDSSWRLATVEFTDALNPAVHSFRVLLRVLKALYFHLLLETQTDPVSGLGLLGWLPTH